METQAGELYHRPMLDMLQLIWGEGFLSPGGPEEVARLIGALDLRGLAVLDIGCGAGGIDIALVRVHGAGFVTAIDVEDTVVACARALIAREGLDARIEVAKVAPGPLPFLPGTFDVVFSKDSMVHIADKDALMAEVFRVLKPGGRFIASDWLISHDQVPSPEMSAYMAAEGLEFSMASPDRYLDAMRRAGFIEVSADSRNAWYRDAAKQELERLRGPLGAAAARMVGQDLLDQNILIWSRMIPVLESGEHCPTHLRARRPKPGLDPGNAQSIDALYGLEPVIEPGSSADEGSVSSGVQFYPVQCPYCGEGFETQLDTSSGSARYVEDCQVCCRPIEFNLEVDHAGALVALLTLRSD